MTTVKFSKTIPEAKTPLRFSCDSVGYDLYTPIPLVIEPYKQICVDIGIVLEMEPHYFVKIDSKSRLARKYNIVAEAGVIDPGYRGNIKVLLRNFGTDIMFFNKHDAIAQMLFIPIYLPSLIEVDEISSDATERGSRGFGGGEYISEEETRIQSNSS